MRLVEIPSTLQSKADIFIKKLVNCPPELVPIVHRLLCVSDYACRHVPTLDILLQEDDCQSLLVSEEYHRLINAVSMTVPSHVFASSIRHFRHRHLLRLLIRELASISTTEQTMTAWSDCADAMISYTLKYCEQQLQVRYGRPCSSSGEPVTLYILAMGKLGGRELNFSSDIDLIFAYSEEGLTDGEESISNDEYFTKVIRLFVPLLQNVTTDGFVFRVDLRLRPNGDSGPLVCSLASMETYYQEQGRDWERYAMVKARLVGLMTSSQPWFERLVRSFVYRRYVDFSVIESLRSMKSMIQREIQLNPMWDDIKRGSGGIREVEFVIQCFQLIYGGRVPSIQKNNAMMALTALKAQHLLEDVSKLQHAYLLLRRLENALQTQNDQQVHTLPQDEVKQLQLTVAMGFTSWESLLSSLHDAQEAVRFMFHAVLDQDDEYQDEKRLLDHQLASLWQGQMEPVMAAHLLADMGYQNSERCYQMIHAFRQAPRCRRLPQVARIRLDRFMVLLLKELAQVKESEQLLLQVLKLLEQIVGRSAYLALLTENPSARHELLHWFVHSSFITALIVEQPFLLEVLIDQQPIWHPPSRRQLAALLQAQLDHCLEIESQDDRLRQFKLTCFLLAARAELYGQCDALRIGTFLSHVAEVIIQNVFERSCDQLQERFPEIKRVKANFAIIAYGKLGSREMNYDSDLDLVFLHTVKSHDEGLVIRLTQKMLHRLTARSQMGVLYLVDTRLRPSGSAGLLVSHLDSFVEYQNKNAWTWEHQALLRARPLQAKKSLKAIFYRLKQAILVTTRDRYALSLEVLSMREKIGVPNEGHAIKYSEGGLLDLEFLVQFLVLAYPDPRFAYTTNTLDLLKKLNANQVINETELAVLTSAYRCFHRALHRNIITSLSTENCERWRLAVKKLIDQFQAP